MAPELYQKLIDCSLAKADVFSLGVILVNILTGEYPFESVKDERYQKFIDDPRVFLKYDEPSLI